MIEIVFAAVCVISVITYMGLQQQRIDELQREAELWRGRYVEAFTRDMTDAIEEDMNRPESPATSPTPRYKHRW